jgi:hypothetical protein
VKTIIKGNLEATKENHYKKSLKKLLKKPLKKTTEKNTDKETFFVKIVCMTS